MYDKIPLASLGSLQFTVYSENLSIIENPGPQESPINWATTKMKSLLRERHYPA